MTRALSSYIMHLLLSFIQSWWQHQSCQPAIYIKSLLFYGNPLTKTFWLTMCDWLDTPYTEFSHWWRHHESFSPPPSPSPSPFLLKSFFCAHFWISHVKNKGWGKIIHDWNWLCRCIWSRTMRNFRIWRLSSIKWMKRGPLCLSTLRSPVILFQGAWMSLATTAQSCMEAKPK